MSWHPAARESSQRQYQKNKKKLNKRSAEWYRKNKDKESVRRKRLRGKRRGISISGSHILKRERIMFNEEMSKLSPETQHAMIVDGVALDRRLKELKGAKK